MMRRSPSGTTAALLLAAACALAAAAAVGCSPAQPGRLSDDPLVQEAQASPGPRVEGGVAFAPIEATYASKRTAADEERAPERCPFVVERSDLERDIASALIGESPVRRLDALEPISTTRAVTVADYIAVAHQRGDEALLQVTLRDVRGEFRGRNAFFWPNLLLWYVFWVPSFFPTDEDYACVIEADATLYDVVSERPLAEEPIKVDVERSLDDFDRGWDIFGLFYLPSSLDAANWARVRETLLPIAQYELTREMVLRAHRSLAPAAAARPASVVGLVVDVARYEKEPAVTSSPSCAQDGRAFHAAIGKLGRVPSKNVLRLSGGAALRHKIEDDLRNRVAQRARAGDTILLYFAGAGTTGPDGQAYLLPADADPAQPLERCAISLGSVGELLAPSRARRLVVVLDASFSSDRALGRSVRFGPENGGAKAAPRLEDLARALPGWSVTLLAAGAADEGAGDLAGAGQGLFTLFLLRAMQAGADKDKDGKTSAEELLLATADKVAVQASVDGRKQKPRLHRWPEPRAGAKEGEAKADWLPTLGYPAPAEPRPVAAEPAKSPAKPDARPETAPAAPPRAPAPAAPQKPVEPIEPKPPPRSR